MEAIQSEEGFSPMRMARAGRRAGKHVAIVDPASTGALQQQEEGEFNSQQELQYQRQLSTHVQGSDWQRQQQQGAPQQLQPRPPAAQQQQQQPQQQAGPPAKRVGFDLQVRAPGADENEVSSPPTGQRFAGVSRRKQEQLQQEEMQEAKHRNKYDEKAVEGVADIPELEEEGREDITRAIAHAPRGPAPRVQAIVELEQNQGWLPSRPDNEDIDLSLLTARLLPSDQVIEAPDVWDYDLLFSQLKAELQNEGPAREGIKNDKEELRQI